MKPAPFEYHAPAAIEEALEIFSQYGDAARILAGGQSLMPMLSLRLAYVERLIDLNRVSGLDYIRAEDGGVAVGAMTRQRTVERSEVIRVHVPLLHEAIGFVGHWQNRNRGTVGGSLAHADPAAEIGAVWLALDGYLTAQSPSGTRVINADEFFQAYFTTVLQPDEILTEVWFPRLQPGASYAFEEVARRHGDFAMAGVAAALVLEEGHIIDARIAVQSVGPTPVRARRAEAALVGTVAGDESFAHASTIVQEEIHPTADVHASAEYRRKLAGVLARRTLKTCLMNAKAARA